MTIQPAPPINKFLNLLKEETGNDVTHFDAVFHRDYTKYRHLPYSDIGEDAWKACFMARTWINVILHEGMTDKIRAELFPNLFDLGNRKLDKDTSARLNDFLAELRCSSWNKYGRLNDTTNKSLKTVRKGLKNTIGYELSDGETDHSVTSLKVINLMYMMTIFRKKNLFQLIKSPILGEAPKPTLEFRDTVPDPLNHEYSLLVADITSYLSIEIPEERLKAIHIQLLSSTKLLDCIATENLHIAGLIFTYHSSEDNQIADAYQNLAERIEKFEPEQLMTETVRLDEAMYIYLRTLEFQHFVGEYENIVDKARTKNPINVISDEINDLCNSIGSNRTISPNTRILSVNMLSEFALSHEEKLRGMVKSATGLYVRGESLDEIINHACKILIMYSFVTFGEKDPDAVVISVSDCIAALCTIRYQKDIQKKIKYSPFVLGQNTPGKCPLEYFNKVKSIEEMLKTDCIPHSVSQIMYRRFCYIHANMTGNGSRYDAWMQFDIARLKKHVQCFQSYDIDRIIESITKLNKSSEFFTLKYRMPPLPQFTVDTINKWL